MTTSGRGQLNAWGYCTRCLWEHNESADYALCYACREYSREWGRQYRERQRKGRNGAARNGASRNGASRNGRNRR